MLRGRRIAFDYGDVRIGVAVSDPDSILSSPLTTLKATDKSLLNQISEILADIEPVPIEMIDERMSTVSAARNLREAGRNAKDSKAAIDRAAAVAILDFALEIEKRK